VYFVGRAIQKLKIPTKYIYLFIEVIGIAYHLKSTNSRVHNMSTYRQITKCHAHKIKWFYSNAGPLALTQQCTLTISVQARPLDWPFINDFGSLAAPGLALVSHTMGLYGLCGLLDVLQGVHALPGRDVVLVCEIVGIT